MFDSSFHLHDPRTIEDFYRPSLIGRGGPIVLTIVPGTYFVLNNHMVQLLRKNCQFHGFEGEDANEHLDKYLSITQFIKQNVISQDIINLNLFPFSLNHRAESWFYTLKTHSIHTWEEMWDSEVQYDTTTDMTAHYSKTTFASSEQVEVLINDTRYTIQSVQHQPGPGYSNTFHYTYFDKSNEDEPSEVLKVRKSIHPLSGETDAFLALDSIPPGINNEIFDAEGDILLLENLLKIDSIKDLPPQELNNDSEGDIIFLEILLKDEPSEAKNS
ncbi:hypothetical protein Tco_0601979 [Tanacetum coccineum]